MPLRDLLKKEPEFKFVRSDTHTQEVITPEERSPRWHRPSSRLFSRSPSPSRGSSNLPENLPDLKQGDGAWAERATMLARDNEMRRSRPSTPNQSLANQAIDDDIQRAIRLHESGALTESTALFGRLADPHGANNALSQVLYGLALRHGWGCTADPARALTYLTAAAGNAASIETINKSSAKGELVLAIFELANCFRHGWGVGKDAMAAKQYYETAANLGDTDAMNEVAWCYLEGFGCRKDKYAAARYYRLAEQGGHKTLGNSWIWKPKYDP